MSEARRHDLDLVCIGRTSVDLYAEQEGARLEDVQSFRKYVGGSATNIAVGTARLGVKSAMLTRVGDEHMGRFVRKTLAENGVDVRAVRLDPENLTPYVLLAVRAIDDFPRIFAYGDAADLAVEEGDVDPRFIASAKALLVTGTPLSRAGARAASMKAIRAARDAGLRPRRGDGGGGKDRRWLHRHARGVAEHPRALGCDHRAQGRRDGGHSLPR